MLDWMVGWMEQPGEEPQRWVPAQVPGAVQLDWARANGWEPYWRGTNYRRFDWMEDVCWSYRAELDVAARKQGERLFFVCRGVDYAFQVWLNGEVLHEQEGMYTPVEIDLTGRAKRGDTIQVVILPAPKAYPDTEGRTRQQARQSLKPPVSYGWDFHPRLVPLGICDDAYIELRPACHVRRAEVCYELSRDLTAAEVRLEVELSEPGEGSLRWRLSEPSGEVCVQAEVPADAASLELANVVRDPKLWWPRGQGDTHLYTSTVELTDARGAVVQELTQRVGFRTVRLVVYEGGWRNTDPFPKGREDPPMTLEVNGRHVFCKGSNWVGPDIFPGRLDCARYRELLELAVGANMNMLRCWGGAAVNKEAFFELCDEMGLMVWQDFPVCLGHESTPEFLALLDRESRSIIRRLRRHPCVVLWCGGNELFNAWNKLTDQSLCLRLLNRNCYDMDPRRPYLPTTPVMGAAHGGYLVRHWDGRDALQMFQGQGRTAYAEFGCCGPSSVEVLREIIPEDELFPQRETEAWVAHHAYDAWVGHESWLMPSTIADYYGPFGSIEELAAAGQLMQAEGFRAMYEEARRQKPRCGMALNWCFNEPWPTAAGNSLVNWPVRPKPALQKVRLACRPALASARVPRYDWCAGDVFEAELWLLNDSPLAVPAGSLCAVLRLGECEHVLGRWDFPDAPPQGNLRGPTVRTELPRAECDRMTFALRVADREDMDSDYVLAYSVQERQGR